ncbi:MAG: redoxin domain-containing protein [Planctomycetes bacterium]|nr:redoxin domain-containing protein [Planctomycetota bacterium]
MNALHKLFSRKPFRSVRGIAALLLVGCLAATGCDQTPSDDTAEADDTTSKNTNPKGASRKETKPKDTRSTDQPELTAEDVLRKMIAAYQKAKHYSDEGVIDITITTNGDDEVHHFSFSVQFARPNQIRIHAYQIQMVSDGEKLQSWIADEETNNLDGQSLQQDIAGALTLDDLYREETAGGTLQGGFGPPLALELLLQDKPLEEMLQDKKNIELLATETIEDRKYHRVKHTDARGDLVFWIDAETFVVRRLEFPTGEILARFSADQRPEKITVVAELVNARFGDASADETFVYEPPKDAVTVSRFVLPPLSKRMPPPVVGKTVTGLSFTDTEGKKITDKTLSGKVVVLDFWFTTCPPCRESMPNLQKVYEQFKDNDKVVFYAVNVDELAITDDALKKTFSDWGVALPIGRDFQGAAAQALQVEAFPSLVLIGKDGTVQSYEMGFNPRLAEMLPAKLNALLAGSNLAEQEIRRIKEEYERELAAAHPDALYSEKVEPAEADEPAKLGLTKLWTSDAAMQPENILVVAGGADEDDDVYVLDQYRTVVSLGADGKSIAKHPLDIAEADLVTYLRTAMGGDGKRYFVGGGAGQPRFHLFDEQWKRRFSLPEADDATQMISDLVLADLDGDEKLEVYVSHWQDLALYRFSLDGKRTAWPGESVRDVLSLALSPVDAEGKRLLLALGRSGKIRGVAADGKVAAESDAPDPTVQKLVVAERNINKDVFWVALSMAPSRGAVVAMKGDSQLAWRFEVPGGFPQTAIEPVVWGHVLPGGQAHWVVAGADGGIHVIAADGNLVDRFHHGEVPRGIGLAKLGGKPTLLISSKSGVTAYRLTEK